MKFLIKNIHTTVTEYTQQQHAFLNKVLTVPVPNHQYMGAFRSGNWDGNHYFYNRQTSSFPTGFLPFIVKHCIKKKWPLAYNDYRTQRYYGSTTDYDYGLRWYQVDAVNSILLGELLIGEEYIPWSRGVIKAPTASGKTPLSARLIEALGVKTLYMVESKDNLYQTKRVFEQWIERETIGMVGDGVFDPQDITIGSLRTLISRRKPLKKFFQSVQCIIVDEVQHLGQNDYHKIMMSCPNAWARIGISATPLSRKDLGDAYLVGDCGDIVYEVERKILEDQGYLSRARVLFIPINQPVAHSAKYPVAYSELIVHNEYRNKKIVWLARKLLEKGRTVLILTKIVEHGRILQKMCKQSGILSYFVSGKDTAQTRHSLLKRVGKEYKILIGNRIFDESVDVPALDDLIIAAGGKSEIRSIQRSGRVLRLKTTGPNLAHIFDFADRGNKYLISHSEERMLSYQGEGFDVRLLP